jgi:hypothetical protein
MYRGDLKGSNSKRYHGHSWAISVKEADGSTTTSCTACHGETFGADAANFYIDYWKTEYRNLEVVARANVARAAAAMQGATDTNLLATLQEAQHNLAYAESDEGHGVHNHNYLMALLNDANQKALSLPVLNAVLQATGVVVSWTGPGTLQEADAWDGPWHDVPNTISPLVITPDVQAQQKFYRLRPG